MLFRGPRSPPKRSGSSPVGDSCLATQTLNRLERLLNATTLNSLNRLECFSVMSGFVTFPPARMFYYGLLQFITVSKILLRSVVPVS